MPIVQVNKHLYNNNNIIMRNVMVTVLAASLLLRCNGVIANLAMGC